MYSELENFVAATFLMPDMITVDKYIFNCNLFLGQFTEIKGKLKD
jgi:hypothetical protein